MTGYLRIFCNKGTSRTSASIALKINTDISLFYFVILIKGASKCTIRHSFYWEPFLCRQLLASKRFGESNIIFNGQTRHASPDQFKSLAWRPASPGSLDNEVSRWFNMCSWQFNSAYLPDTLMKSLLSSDPDSFPNIIILLVLGCTLLATFAEAERRLSVLRLIKSHLRSRMAATRFYAVKLMKIHYPKDIDSKTNCRWIH